MRSTAYSQLFIVMSLLAVAGPTNTMAQLPGDPATSGTNSQRRETSKALLADARTAIRANDFVRAEKLIAQAEQLKVSYDPVWGRLADTPEKLRRELTAARGSAPKPQMPTDRFAPPPSPLGEPAAAPSRSAPASNPPPAPFDPRREDPANRLTNDMRSASSGPDLKSPLLQGGPDSDLPPANRLPALNLPPDLQSPPPSFDSSRFPSTSQPSLTMQPLPGPSGSNPQPPLISPPKPESNPASLSISDNSEFLRSRMDESAPLDTRPQGRPAAPPGKAEAQRLLAEAKTAMDRGELDVAQQYLRDVSALNVPETAYQPGELRPWQLAMQLDSVMSRRQAVPPQNNLPVARAGAPSNNSPNTNSRFPVAQAAGSSEGPRYPVTQGRYNPAQDRSRTVPAQAEDAPTGAANNVPNTGAPTSGAGAGQSYYQQGLQALQNQDRAKALSLFKEAWKYQNELDPNARAQLRDKLILLQQAAPEALPPGRDASPLESVTAQQRMVYDKLQHEIFLAREQAEKLKPTDPRAGLERLMKLRERIASEQIEPPAAKVKLQTSVDREINSLKKFIEENRSEIDNAERTARILGEIDQQRRTKDEVQQKISELYEMFNKLVDERRFAEAEMLARQAYELQPENPVAEALIWKSKFMRRVMELKGINERKEDGFVNTMFAVDEASTPFDDREPFVIGDPKRWNQLTHSRRKLLERQRKRFSPAEMQIQRSLSQQVEVRFNNRPLREVIDVLSAATGVNFHLDPQGMAVEGVTSDVPVNLDLKQPISLRSALNLILQPLRLGFVIRDEVLKITSEQTRESDVYPQVYDVADLVIPIPNFAPGYNTGLPNAIAEAHRALGYGNSLPSMGSMPLTLANNQASPANASVLAQMGAGGLLGGGNRMPQQMGSGPGGLGSGSNADFDTLIDLLTSSVSPKTWSEVGGSGSIEAMPSNLSIVVSQTQEVHDQIADLLEQLRRLQDLQVTIEVRFITLSDNFFERMGVDFDFTVDDNSRLNEATLATPAALPDDVGRAVTIGLGPAGTPSGDLDIPFRQNSFGIAVPAATSGFVPDAGLQMGMAILSDIEVFFLLNAAAGDNRSNVLQAPKVTLFNGQQASVFDTAQRPFVIGIIPVVGDFAAAHQPVIVVLNEGTSMNVQAVVSSDRRFVRLTLVPFFSQIGRVDTFTFNGRTTTNSGTIKVDPTDDESNVIDGVQTTTEGTTVQLPTFQFTTVTTTVSVPDGGTVLLGGIKRLRENRVERGVPMLNKIPYVSRLFKNVGIGREAQSLMMMVTPRIIIQEEEEEKLGLNQPAP